MSENEHVLLILLHHIVGDGWSLQPLTRDFTAAYKARCQGDRVQLETLPVQYADYALWQQQLLGDETTQESLISTQLDFGKKNLKVYQTKWSYLQISSVQLRRVTAGKQFIFI